MGYTEQPESLFSLEDCIQAAAEIYEKFRRGRMGQGGKSPCLKIPPDAARMNFDLFAKGENIAVFFHTNNTKYEPLALDPPMHSHDFYEINYVYRGSVTNRLTDRTIRQGTGQVLLMNPYASHSPKVDSPDTVLFNILIRKKFSADILRTTACQDDNLINLFLSSALGMGPIQSYLLFDNSLKITLVLQDMIREYYGKRPYYQQVLYSKLIELWSLFARQKDEKRSSRTDASDPDGLDEILSYMQKQCRSVTLEEVAKKFGFSVSHLSRYIDKYTGYKFNQIIHQFKMQSAVSYLLHSELPIAEVAEIVGYNDVSYFRKVFKKDFGVSPGSYRIQNTGKQGEIEESQPS